MKRARPISLGIAVLALLLLVGLTLLLNGGVQTWLARKVIASHPEWHLAVRRVSVGLDHLDVDGVQLVREGLTIDAPSVRVRLSVPAAIVHRRFLIAKLEADGWVATLSPTASASSAAPGATHAAAAPANATVPLAQSPANESSAEFTGIFPALSLPGDVAIDALALTGQIRRGDTTVQVRIHGGDLGVGREGVLALDAESALTGQEMQTVAAHGELKVRMDTPRTFSELLLSLALTARGGALPAPVLLQTEAEAHRSGAAERYRIKTTGGGRLLAEVAGEFVRGTDRLTGNWRLDVRDADVAPFLPGRPIPSFVISGQGTLDTDARFAALHAAGRLDAEVDHLAVLSERLADVGAVKLTADVDLARQNGIITVAKCAIDVASNHAGRDPAVVNVATVRALQAFEFNPGTGDVQATDAARDLVGVVLHGLPLAWARPLLHDLEVTGENLRGEFSVTPRAGGLTFKSTVPLAISHFAVSQPGRAWLNDVDISAQVAGDYTPRGWQAELRGGSVRAGDGTLLLLEGKAGRLAGPGQPVKATGLASLNLATLVAQPIGRGLLALNRGEATVEFAASVGTSKEVQATVAVKNLAGPAVPAGATLPTVTAKVRADVSADNRITFNVPVTLARGDSTSDLTVIGAIAGGEFEAQAASSNFVIDDASVLSVLLPTKSNAGQPGPPPWTGWKGSISLQLKRVVYSGGVQMSNVVGTLRLADGTVTFDGTRAGFGAAGEAKASGAIRYDSKEAEPYSLAGELVLNDFDPGPLLAALNPRQLPTMEGRFAVTSKVSARAGRMGLLPLAALGDFEITSRSGVFRGLAVNVGNLVETSSRLRAWLAAAGDVITSPFMGAKDQDEISSRSQAANELAKIFSNITYDQLGLVISRQEASVAQVKEFTLISPDLRITGTGVARGGTSNSPFKGVVDLELHLRARGRPAELMKYLGILEPKSDDLGYAACTLPVHLEGPIDRPDTTQLSNRLVALAMAKPGLTEKAVDWINRLRGKSPN